MQIDVTIRTIGNSKGIILPKQYLEEFGFGEKAILEMDPEAKSFTLRPPSFPRKGWAEALEAFPPEELTTEERDWLEFEDEGYEAV